MTTYNQGQRFISELILPSLLDDAISWISTNLNPEEVFDNDALEQWAKDNGFKEVEENK